MDTAPSEKARDDLDGQPPSQPVTPTKTTVWIMAGGLVVFCLCALVCSLVFVPGMLKRAAQSKQVPIVLDAVMQSMAAGDTQKAYELFSKSTPGRLDLAGVQAMLQENTPSVFSGYQSLKISAINFNTSYNYSTSPTSQGDQPAGQFILSDGTLTYSGGLTRKFEAILVEEQGELKIYRIDIQDIAEK